MQYLVLIAILPSLFIAFLVYKADKKEKEPKKELLKAFLSGGTSVALTLLISYIIGVTNFKLDNNDFVNVAIYSFIGIGLVEEFCKWICSYFFLKDNKHFNYLFDGIVYATFISLGFATIENVLYTFSGGLATGLFRAITTVPAHAFFGISSGYLLSLAKKEKLDGNKGRKCYYLFLSLLVPFLLHGFYDFCLFTQNYYFFMIYIVFVVSLYVFSIGNVRRMMLIDHRFKKKKKYR